MRGTSGSGPCFSPAKLASLRLTFGCSLSRLASSTANLLPGEPRRVRASASADADDRRPRCGAGVSGSTGTSTVNQSHTRASSDGAASDGTPRRRGAPASTPGSGPGRRPLPLTTWPLSSLRPPPGESACGRRHDAFPRSPRVRSPPRAPVGACVCARGRFTGSRSARRSRRALGPPGARCKFTGSRRAAVGPPGAAHEPARVRLPALFAAGHLAKAQDLTLKINTLLALACTLRTTPGLVGRCIRFRSGRRLATRSHRASSPLLPRPPAWARGVGAD